MEHIEAPAGDVRPDGHCVQTAAPDLATLPFSHGIQTELFIAPRIKLLDPGGHGLQVLMFEAPVAVEYIPCVHFLQLDTEKLPIVSLHVPASQGLQVPVPLSG